MIESWQEFVQNVKEWATARNLIKGSTVQAQGLKGLSEAGELADNFAKGKDIRDDIGDCCVVAVITELQHGHRPIKPIINLEEYATPYDCIAQIAREFAYAVDANCGAQYVPDAALALCYHTQQDFLACLSKAWNDIKDRKGIMHNGVFIKESDPRYKELVDAT